MPNPGQERQSRQGFLTVGYPIIIRLRRKLRQETESHPWSAFNRLLQHYLPLADIDHHPFGAVVMTSVGSFWTEFIVVCLPTAAHISALSFDPNPERALVRTNQPCWLALSDTHLFPYSVKT
jgi:hypothetical protein